MRQLHVPPAACAAAGLLKEVEARGQRHEYQRLLAECHNLYAQCRLQLVAPLVAQRLAQVGARAWACVGREDSE